MVSADMESKPDVFVEVLVKGGQSSGLLLRTDVVCLVNRFDAQESADVCRSETKSRSGCGTPMSAFLSLIHI